ncbi:hypothetical protein, partial [Fodinicurvata halophila]
KARIRISNNGPSQNSSQNRRPRIPSNNNQQCQRAEASLVRMDIRFVKASAADRPTPSLR